MRQFIMLILIMDKLQSSVCATHEIETQLKLLVFSYTSLFTSGKNGARITVKNRPGVSKRHTQSKESHKN